LGAQTTIRELLEKEVRMSMSSEYPDMQKKTSPAEWIQGMKHSVIYAVEPDIGDDL
jgi:hypothetical protein